MHGGVRFSRTVTTSSGQNLSLTVSRCSVCVCVCVSGPIRHIRVTPVAYSRRHVYNGALRDVCKHLSFSFSLSVCMSGRDCVGLASIGTHLICNVQQSTDCSIRVDDIYLQCASMASVVISFKTTFIFLGEKNTQLLSMFVLLTTFSFLQLIYFHQF